LKQAREITLNVVREYLKLFRIHTAALTMAIVMLGYALAAESINIKDLFLFALFGLLFHAIGFLDNNICDYKYDLKDPSKKHFPLITGTICLEKARAIRLLGLILIIAMGLYLSRQNLVAMVVLVFAIVNGLIYNRICKKSLLAPIPITLCFAPLVLYSYLCVSKTLNNLIIIVFLFAVLQLLYQIAYSGYYKDLNDPVNLLRKLGMQIKYNLIIPSVKTACFAIVLKALNVLIGIYIWLLKLQYISLVPLLLVITFLMLQVAKQTSVIEYNQQVVTGLCAKVEILTYFLLVFALAGKLGLAATTFFVVFPLAWYVVLNYLTWYDENWRSIIAPRV
jgi:4-hydroxybenzoate polyprenyltransferase